MEQGQELEKETNFKLLIIVTLGLFVATLDTSMINLAISKISDYFSISISMCAWLITIYLIVYVILLPVYGKLADIFGRKRFIIAGMFVFSIGSVLCFFAKNFYTLLGFRILQATGASACNPAAAALIKENFSKKKRGMAMGIYGAGAGLGGLMGPPISGILNNFFSWNSIFIIDLILAISVFIGGIFMIPRTKILFMKDKRFDFVGTVFLTISLFSLVLGLTLLKSNPENLRNNLIIISASLLFLIFFTIMESKTSYPIIDLKLLKNKIFFGCSITMAFHNFAMYGILFLVMLFLQKSKGQSPMIAGISLIPFPVALSILMPIGGLISDKFGRKLPPVIGTILLVISLCILAIVQSNVLIGVGLVFSGLGIGFAYSSLAASSVEAPPKEMVGMASAFYRLIKWLGGAFGTLIASLLLPKVILIGTSFRFVYLVFACVVANGIFTSLLLEGGVVKEKILCE